MMIRGLFSYQLFGQTVYITTTQVTLAIVVLLLLVFAIIANRRLKKAEEVPGTFQNILELRRKAGRHDHRFHGPLCRGL